MDNFVSPLHKKNPRYQQTILQDFSFSVTSANDQDLIFSEKYKKRKRFFFVNRNYVPEY